MKKGFLLNIIALFLFQEIIAQEKSGPVNYNPHVRKIEAKPKLKTTALTLPFFEDFTDASPLPNFTRWVDRSVYINNSMAVSAISRGVATFDALNWQGGPYDSTNIFSLLYADSLTSQSIDLSFHNPGDSIYLSFFYQPQGRGFAPEVQDSLMLYFLRSDTTWTKVWAKEGTTLDSFRQVMVPVANVAYLHSGFQFRFVNKASKFLTDDIWNLDYIRLNANRNFADTALGDIATISATNMLNDYTSMPYRQFTANTSKELSTTHSFLSRNLSGAQQSVVYGYTAREQITNTPLFNSSVSNANIPFYGRSHFSFPVYPINYASSSPYNRVVFENKYFTSDPSTSWTRTNDTIIHEQVFDNYLAYDDGTAEIAYWLTPFTTLPAKTAVEFHLNQPDTLRGLAIYFGRQVPLAFSKFFSIDVYKNITLGSFLDTPIYQTNLNTPGYEDSINHFWVYRFDDPVPLSAGTFFIGTTQPAQSGSDSLYFALDMNRVGGNHRYVNIDGFWASSNLQGVMMIRPLLGQPVIGTSIQPALSLQETEWSVYPNPTKNFITIRADRNEPFIYELTDMQGRILYKNTAISSQSLDICGLSSGIYFVRILSKGYSATPKKIIKL
ncbi:MAG TPA: T9SS type A sorting domain-containing protein [Flavipsychrobacter sp.]|nr:T9SS type A sorting domain-containing protein [Flavipsychrobacter sp.]